jgi:hypothetical protein
MTAEVGVEIAFTDAAGNHWIRSADGAIASCDRPAAEFYDLPLPFHSGDLVPEKDV